MKPIITLLGMALACQMTAAPLPVVEYTTTGTLFDTRPFTLGYRFTTSVPFNINALGYWDDGLGNDHQVGIWTNGGALLVSTTVLGTDPLTGHFRYHSIPTYALAPGTYVIGGEFLGNGDPFPSSASGLIIQPGFTWNTDLQLFGAGLNFPTVDTGGGYGNNGILAANFSVGEGAAIPEPGTCLLVAAGLLLTGLRSRRVI
jgi:hypothetical protein